MTPVVDENRFHPNFARILKIATPEEREVLADWSSAMVDRDGKFVIEFQTTFNSSFWELYLASLFRSWRLNVDYAHSRPDFVVTSGRFGKFSAEAVVASNPKDGLPQWTNKFDELPPPRETVLDLAVQRLAQAVTEKRNKFRDSYSKLAHCAGLPYIICVAPFEQPWGFLQGTEAIARVVFGGRRPVTIKDDGGVERVVGTSSGPAPYKPSGAAVPIGLLEDPSFSDVSAVFFSGLATWSKVRALAKRNSANLLFHYQRWDIDLWAPVGGTATRNGYVESLVDGAHLFLNSHAVRPIDPEPWLEVGVAVHQFTPNGTYSIVPGDQLVSRICQEFAPAGTYGDAFVGASAPPGSRAHEPSQPPDGVPFGGPTIVSTWEVELMTHRGSTLQIGRDTVDGDWCVLVKPGVYRAVQDFLSAKHEPWMGSLVPAREDAIAQGREFIDATFDANRQ